MVELTVTMRIDTDKHRVYALEVTGENVLVDLIIHLDEVLQADLSLPLEKAGARP